MKRRYIAFILIMIMTLSTFGIPTAFAGISGNSEVYAGETYNFSVSQSASASSISGNISWSGFASGSETMWEDSSSGTNENITASKTISISVPTGTPAGSTCTINVSGQISTFDGTTVGESSYSDSKTITVVDRPASTPKPQKTPKPSSSSKTESKPTSTPEPSAWQLASDEVDGMEQGGTLTVDLTGKDDDHEIPVEIYNVLREKKGKLTLNFGSYSCTLDGAALGELDEDEDELDLGLSFEADEEYSAAVGGNDVYQLHFDHKGQFPGIISFTFKAEKNKPGDTVYLYYYYGTSKVIEGIQSAIVDENGFVTFDIYHCSSYFVSSELIEGAAGIVTQAEPEPTPTPEPEPTPTPEPTADPTPEPEPNPLTAELTPINGFPLAVLISVGFGAALLAVLFTMIIFRVGLFRKKSTRRSEY